MRRSPIPPKQRGRRAPVIPKIKKEPVSISLAEALNYRDWNGTNYAGPVFACGFCSHFHYTATMLIQDEKGKKLEPMKNRRCPLKPGGPGHVTREGKIKCQLFGMHERFFQCERRGISIHPKACAWSHHHNKDPKCKGCKLGATMEKWMEWHNYGIPDKKNRTVGGLQGTDPHAN